MAQRVKNLAEMWVKWSEVAQSCPTLCDLMDCSSSVHGIFQARVLEWVAISFSKGSSWPGFNPWDRKIPWRRTWLPSPVLWPGEFHGQRSLASYSPWGCKELDMTDTNIDLSICIMSSLFIYASRTCRLFLYLGYCKPCCSEHWGACILLN